MTRQRDHHYIIDVDFALAAGDLCKGKHSSQIGRGGKRLSTSTGTERVVGSTEALIHGPNSKPTN